MRRRIGKRIKTGLRQISEDLQEIQKRIRHKSVYAKKSFTNYSRHPKHPKKPQDYTTSY
jgi:hypothetical protein